ncbi:MAG TPA: radical SAM family heme chaperone HemW [Acidimicrobiales bacterium]|nr:radical SAM family heme chaperone HemW [Acidimicrobiales bacterium]
MSGATTSSWPVSPESAGFGVYVHVPFCTRRCDYCAFATWTDRFSLARDYVGACVAEARRARYAGEMPPATSVFFGGGTPSLLEPDAIGSILSEIQLEDGAEVTVECNPDTVDEVRLRGYGAVGVNRLSFGVQSMVPHVLRSLGRSHSAGAVRSAVEAAARAGFEGAYNVDLIFGGVGESVDDWSTTLSAVLALDPPPTHVSAYALTVEPGTPLAADPSRHPDPDDQADKYALADTVFSQVGLEWYEISNWAVPGHECRHNLLYWRQGEYLGIGCAAHSHRRDRAAGTARRWWNVRTPERYIKLVTEGAPAEAAGEDLSSQERVVEALQLALRTRGGIPASALPDDPALDGLVEPSGSGMVALTTRGRLLANEVALRLQVPSGASSVS